MKPAPLTGPSSPGTSRTRRALDVSMLPTYAFGHQGLIWWGTVGFMVIEGSMFLMIIAAYFFLRTRVPDWPPSLPNPDATIATINTIVLVVSALPNHLTKRAAERMDLRTVRLLLPVCIAFGVAFTILRWFEFSSLNARWDSNAYGSVVWFLLGLHTTHLVTDVLDTIVLTALVYTGHVDPKRMVDVSENGLYWYFVVLSWIPIYLIVYFAPRWL